MKFILFDDLLKNEDLQKPDLEILRQDARLYKAALFQPNGDIKADSQFIGNANQETAMEKFLAFFKLVISEKAALAVTPEYSCPWSVIEELIDDEHLPSENALWVIGCESISPKKLKELIIAKQNIKWIYEEDKIEDNLEKEKFLDGLCYIFKTLNGSNSLTTVIAVQFKTQDAGGSLQESESNLILGDHIYIIENRDYNSSRLVGLICSDVLNNSFNLATLPQFANHPYIVLHVQLIDNSFHNGFRKYRSDTYVMGRETKEFVCLNWARDATGRGGSALYIKTKIPKSHEQIDTSDHRINENHKHGLYYTYWVEKYVNIFLINYDEYIFVYQNLKPSQEMVRPTNRKKRIGPEMLKIFSWFKDSSTWHETVADDGFLLICSSNRSPFRHYLKYLKHQPTDIERFVALSVGNVDSEEWYQPLKHYFFQVDDNEINARMTFTHNPCRDTQNQRIQYLTRMFILYDLLKNNVELPTTWPDSNTRFTLRYRKGEHSGNFNVNLFPKDRKGLPATGVYLGETSAEAANNSFDKIQKIFGDQKSFRLIVWYTDDTRSLRSLYKKQKPKITDKSHSNQDYTKKK